MLAVQVTGAISKAPETRQTQRGNPFAFTSVKLQTPDGDQYVNITAFDSELVDMLTRLKPGDIVTACGAGKLSIWTDREGNARPNLAVTVNRLVAIADKAAAPRAKPARQYAAAAAPAAAPVPETASFEFADDVPF